MNNQDMPLANPTTSIDAMATRIKELRLEAPVMLLLEAHRPVTSLLHNCTILLKPLLSPLFGYQRYFNLQELLADREKIELLLRKLEG